jgi:putative IMPACT (imprinted ancient) family translation regulator
VPPIKLKTMRSLLYKFMNANFETISNCIEAISTRKDGRQLQNNLADKMMEKVAKNSVAYALKNKLGNASVRFSQSVGSDYSSNPTGFCMVDQNTGARASNLSDFLY